MSLFLKMCFLTILLFYLLLIPLLLLLILSPLLQLLLNLYLSFPPSLLSFPSPLPVGTYVPIFIFLFYLFLKENHQGLLKKPLIDLITFVHLFLLFQRPHLVKCTSRNLSFITRIHPILPGRKQCYKSLRLLTLTRLRILCPFFLIKRLSLANRYTK